MRCAAGLLRQLERCGLSAQLADAHPERSENGERGRLVKQEIRRVWETGDQATLPEADAAIKWMLAQRERGILMRTSDVDLVDGDTGEVLTSGRVDAVLPYDGVAIRWKMLVRFDMTEPEDDLGLLAMGLGLFGKNGALETDSEGRAFRVAYALLDEHEVVLRRSPEFALDAHAALLDRIHTAASQPPVACPGDWCSACKQRWYCPAWKARTELALTVLPAEVQALEITDQNAPALWVRIRAVEQACELAKDQVKSFVRAGGRLTVDGKQYYLAQCEGRETADVKAIKAAGLTQYLKQGAPYETTRWKSIKGSRAA